MRTHFPSSHVDTIECIFVLSCCVLCFSPPPLFQFVLLAAYILASGFMAVIDMSIDTIFLSFLEDSHLHGGNPRYAPQKLLDVVGTLQKEEDDLASK